MSGRPRAARAICKVALLALLSACQTPVSGPLAASGPPPIPATAQGLQPATGKTYIAESIGDDLWWIGNGAYMVMLMAGPDGVALVDAPPSMDGMLVEAVAELTGGRSVTHLIYSHHHGDHIGAAARFSEATIVAQAETTALLARGEPCEDCIDDPDPRPRPTVTFSESYHLDLGDGQVLDLRYHGPNHSRGNIVIHAPNHRALMVVDVVYPGYVPFDLLAVSSDIPGWVSALDDVLSYDFDVLVGGHISRTGSREDVQLAKSYVGDLREAATRALADNQRSDIIPAAIATFGPADGWWLTNRHTEAVVAQCATDIRQAWTGRLAGVETFADSHCKRMQFSLRID